MQRLCCPENKEWILAQKLFYYFIECCCSQSSISKIKISWPSLAWSTTNKTCANQYYHAAVQPPEKTLQDQSVWKGPTKMFQLCSDNPRTRLWRRYRNQDIQGMWVIVNLTISGPSEGLKIWGCHGNPATPSRAVPSGGLGGGFPPPLFWLNTISRKITIFIYPRFKKMQPK